MNLLGRCICIALFWLIEKKIYDKSTCGEYHVAMQIPFYNKGYAKRMEQIKWFSGVINNNYSRYFSKFNFDVIWN